jgi:hypothetical protein
VGQSRRRILGLAGAGIALALVAGCGGTGDARNTVVSAATRTLSQSVLASVTFTGSTVFGRNAAPVGAREGSVFSRGLAYEAIDVPDASHESTSRQFLFFQPGTLYFWPGSAAGRAALPSAEDWISVPLTRVAESLFPRFVEQAEGLTPQLLLDEIAWGAQSASSQGREVVNHIPFAKYTVSVSLRRALAAATGPGAAAIRLAIRDELSAMHSRVPAGRSQPALVTVWIDGPGRIARLEGALPGSGLGTVTFVLSNYGIAVSGSTPRPAQIVAIYSVLHAGSGTARSPLAMFR